MFSTHVSWSSARSELDDSGLCLLFILAKAAFFSLVSLMSRWNREIGRAGILGRVSAVSNA